MKKIEFITAFVAGILFGLGLIVAQMVNPQKVLNFLDVAGDWDPSLMFVMIGAIFVSFFAFKKAKTLQKTIIGEAIHLPAENKIDIHLIGSASLFGIGWGLAGYCPGPALVSLIFGYTQSIVFVLAMLFGMLLYQLIFVRQLKQ